MVDFKYKISTIINHYGKDGEKSISSYRYREYFDERHKIGMKSYTYPNINIFIYFNNEDSIIYNYYLNKDYQVIVDGFLNITDYQQKLIEDCINSIYEEVILKTQSIDIKNGITITL